MQRREFLKSATLAAIATTTMQQAEGFAAQTQEIPHRTLGRTGQKVSVLGIGGYHLGISALSADQATRIVRTALDSGVNFLDNCWDYNDGESEVRMGKALKNGYRQKAFLMTKIDGRTRASAQQQLEQSLRRLQTEHLDLIQIHEVIRMNDPERVFASGGSLEYLEQARKEGKVRFIGFTGHKSPEIHLHMIDVARQHQYTFDTVQMPLNVMDAHFDSFTRKVVPVAASLNMGILGMKPMANGIILESKTVGPVECLHYAMNLPITTVITGCDSMEVLEQALDAARRFRPLSQDQVAAILGKTANVAQAGRFEPYKTSTQFDGTGHNPQWLG
jgi:predicted aldo/keto reductase-like oxidoreductase